MSVTLGVEQLIAAPPAYLNGQRIGLLCNTASVDRHLVHTRQRLHTLFGSRLTCLFSPQHGLFAEKQDNMIESADRHDPLLKIPVSHCRARFLALKRPFDGQCATTICSFSSPVLNSPQSIGGGPIAATLEGNFSPKPSTNKHHRAACYSRSPTFL